MTRRKLARGEKAFFASSLLLVVGLLISSQPRLAKYYQPLSELLQPIASRNRSSCETNLKYIYAGMELYRQDYDDKYPAGVMAGARPAHVAASVAPKGWEWMDALEPYLVIVHDEREIFQCPNDSASPVIKTSERKGQEHISYWMNANLAGFSQSRVPLSFKTVLVGEGDDGVDNLDATYGKSALPLAWLHNIDSPLYRHMGTAKYLFVDGHVKWFTPQQIQAFGGKRDVCVLR